MASQVKYVKSMECCFQSRINIILFKKNAGDNLINLIHRMLSFLKYCPFISNKQLKDSLTKKCDLSLLSMQTFLELISCFPKILWVTILYFVFPENCFKLYVVLYTIFIKNIFNPLLVKRLRLFQSRYSNKFIYYITINLNSIFNFFSNVSLARRNLHNQYSSEKN